jgi:hypothetical protein
MIEIISEVFQVLTYVDIIAFFVLTVFLLIHINRLPLVLKIFSLFETVAFIIVLVSLILAKLSMPNTPYFHLLYFIQILWFSVFYYQILKEWRFNKVIFLASGVFLLFSFWKYLSDWTEMTGKVGGIYYFISTLLFVAFAVLFYMVMLMGKVKPKFQLINAAILIYYSCSSVIFLFSKYYYLEGFEGQMILWVINVVLHILFVFLIFVDVWKTLYRHPKT